MIQKYGGSYDRFVTYEFIFQSSENTFDHFLTGLTSDTCQYEKKRKLFTQNLN